MYWVPLAERGPLDSDFGDLSPPLTTTYITAQLELEYTEKKIPPNAFCHAMLCHIWTDKIGYFQKLSQGSVTSCMTS
jgi:hypothetical protein